APRSAANISRNESISLSEFGIGGSLMDCRPRPGAEQSLEPDTPRLGLEPDPLQRAYGIAERNDGGTFRALRPEGLHHEQDGSGELLAARRLLQLREHAGFRQVAVIGLRRAARDMPELHRNLVVEGIEHRCQPMQHRSAEAAA